MSKYKKNYFNVFLLLLLIAATACSDSLIPDKKAWTIREPLFFDSTDRTTSSIGYFIARGGPSIQATDMIVFDDQDVGVATLNIQSQCNEFSAQYRRQIPKQMRVLELLPIETLKSNFDQQELLCGFKITALHKSGSAHSFSIERKRLLLGLDTLPIEIYLNNKTTTEVSKDLASFLQVRSERAGTLKLLCPSVTASLSSKGYPLRFDSLLASEQRVSHGEIGAMEVCRLALLSDEGYPLQISPLLSYRLRPSVLQISRTHGVKDGINFLLWTNYELMRLQVTNTSQETRYLTITSNVLEFAFDMINEYPSGITEHREPIYHYHSGIIRGRLRVVGKKPYAIKSEDTSSPQPIYLLEPNDSLTLTVWTDSPLAANHCLRGARGFYYRLLPSPEAQLMELSSHSVNSGTVIQSWLNLHPQEYYTHGLVRKTNTTNSHYTIDDNIYERGIKDGDVNCPR